MKFLLRRLLALLPLLASPAHAEVMLQYFNASWAEITRKMPELAEAGYDSLWLPPPTKGSGGLSVGYDLWDRFDLGSKDQRGSVRTRYGTEGELLELMRVAHRFGIRVYFDNIMNHNAFDVPGYNAITPIDLYPGFVPEDFHLRRTGDGFYRKWDNTRDWNDAWQVQNLGLADLIDIATEPGGTNFNHGAYEGDTIPKLEFVRHPDHPEYYCHVPTAPGQKHANGEGSYVGFGAGNGITAGLLASEADFYSERVEDMLHRAARWQLDRTRADGFRLDAVKHTPADFFGATFGPDKDSSNYGYSGQIQLQFNLSRGFSDWDNHRDSVFNTEQGRDDAMLFGEHLGQPPAYGPYIDAGMRLIDNDLRSNLNNLLGNPSAGLAGYDQPGAGGFSPSVAVMHAQSHDNDYASRRELQHALYFTREGVGLVYTDGNHHAGTLGGSGGAFPRHANTAFLGQWGDTRIPNLLKLHNDFARGYQNPRWSDVDFVAYERIDKRENGGMSDAAGTTMILLLNDNFASGQARSVATSFPSAGGSGSEDNPNTGDEYLFQYARGYGSQVGFYSYASQLGSVVVDPGSYFIFAPRTPEEADPWRSAGGAPITIEQGGEPAGTVTVTRRDGSEGDPGFNPYGLPDPAIDDYAYSISLPRVTDPDDLRFVVRTDGSAENILFKLDGGIDLNGTRPGGNTDPWYRDNPPALSTDVFLGYEQSQFVKRCGPEKFAATIEERSQIGSAGAETYTVGGATVPGGGGNPGFDDTVGGAEHDPAGSAPDAGTQLEDLGGSLEFWVRTDTGLDGYSAYLYHTSDGSDPEGSGGGGVGTTEVLPMSYDSDFGGFSWFRAVLNPVPSGTIKYKISVVRESEDGFPLASVYPSGPLSVDQKKRMMSVFEIDGFDGTAVSHAPHNDYGDSEVGLDEGFHVLRARAFLKRDGKASLYNTYIQTFYYDSSRPDGELLFPAENETVGGSDYGAVVRADRSTTEVWYRIDDGDGSNDDATTGVDNGNGGWVKASEVTPALPLTPSDPGFTREFRFNYVNIPSSGSATIQVRLRELSSSADDVLSDVGGHFTTITRNVSTAGADLRLFVAYPPADGDGVDETYVLKAYFSKALADGLNEADLKARFLVRYGADDLWPGSAQALDSGALSIVYNETVEYHALAFSLPNLYDGSPDFLYRLEVTHDRPDPLADLLATRRLAPLPGTWDGDGDGLPRDWELANGLDDDDPSGVNGGQGDPDGDGTDNMGEWLLGMNPRLGDARPVPVASVDPGGIRIGFATLPHRIYQLQVGDDPGAWVDLGPPVNTVGEPGPGWIEYVDPAASVRRFYRMVVSAW